MLTGRIVKNISNTYQVMANNEKYDCQPRGKFRELKVTPLVGDFVEFDEKEHYLLKILPRKNELNRPSICNIDIALIVTSVACPDLSLSLLDKQICSVILANIKPVICFTKLDLINKQEKKEVLKLRKYYETIGIRAFTNEEIKDLIKFLKGKYIVLTGQTGAGKSSLINKIDPKKNLNVGEISIALGRGKHTTRHTEFYEIEDCFIADTPGFSSLDLKKYSKEEVRDSFPEFVKLTCKYRDCMHIKEDDCEVKKQVKENRILKSRYENYCDFVGDKK